MSYRSLHERREGLEAFQTSLKRSRRRRMKSRRKRMMMIRRWREEEVRYSGGQPGGGGGHVGKLFLGPFYHLHPSPAAPASRFISPRRS